MNTRPVTRLGLDILTGPYHTVDLPPVRVRRHLPPASVMINRAVVALSVVMVAGSIGYAIATLGRAAGLL
jgi:hypothetical protein